jgi:glycerate dehydrogenase
MKIVVLDGYTMNPGDNPWDELAALGDLTLYDRTPPSDVVERCRGAEIVLTNKAKLRAKELANLPDLNLIVVTATGTNVVDIDAARAKGVVVCNAPAYSTDAVAQHVFALLFELSNHVGMHDRSVKAGDWSAAPDWTYWKAPLMELHGLTLGIVGFGNIGRRVGELAHAFGMSVLAASRTTGHPPAYQPFTWGSIGEVFSQADVVSLHCPQTLDTTLMVDRKRLDAMKPDAILINTARGGLVDEPVLADVLREGHLRGAALDVVDWEPIANDHPLLSISNCVITPHLAWAALASRQRLMHITVENVRAFQAGTPQNVVS